MTVVTHSVDADIKERTYPPAPPGKAGPFHCGSRGEYDRLYKQSLEDPEGFWGKIAEEFHWHKKWEAPFYRYNFDSRKGPVSVEWFLGAETNMAYNCLDRNVERGLGDKVAFYWEGNSPGKGSTLTYRQLLEKVNQTANYLKSVGVKRGDDVTIYLPMVSELPASMLACARIGAVHSVVFAGFSAESLAGRILDSKPRVVLTCSAVMRGAKKIQLKNIVDSACEKSAKQGHKVEVCLVLDNSSAQSRADTPFKPDVDVWWQDAVGKQSRECAVEWMGAEEPLFKLYTSGSTGQPKGVLHTLGGYMIGAATTCKYVFDMKPEDVYWCTADCGWITGHTYVTYGPLLNGQSQVIFEGVPTYPDASRAWEIVDKYSVTTFYTAPTAIRSLMAAGQQHLEGTSRKSLRILGTVGEPINPEAWRWYREEVGSGLPIVDTYWQTETGAHMITPLPGATALCPGSATLPFFGVEPAVLSEKGEELQGPCQGMLCFKRSWPSSMRTLSGNHQRFEEVYFNPYPGYYFTGDGCRRDEHGYYWLTEFLKGVAHFTKHTLFSLLLQGRVDDIINVSGHRIGTAEVEGSLTQHPACAEAAVVPFDHPIKGSSIYAYVTLMEGTTYPPPEGLKKELINTVREYIGAIAAPDVIHWAPALPKTRSGKIMRRVLRKIATRDEHELGDTSTLADPSVVQLLISLRGK